jgi:hypothetical protein
VTVQSRRTGKKRSVSEVRTRHLGGCCLWVLWYLCVIPCLSPPLPHKVAVFRWTGYLPSLLEDSDLCFSRTHAMRFGWLA